MKAKVSSSRDTTPSPSSIRKGKVTKRSKEDLEVSNYLDELKLLLPSASSAKSQKNLSHLDVIESVIQYVRELQETLDMDAHEMDLLEYETSCITLAA